MKGRFYIGGFFFGVITAVVASGCQPAAVERGWKALKAGQLAKADAVVNQALSRHADSLGLWDLKLRICLLQQKWADCPKVFRQVRRRDPGAVRWGLDLIVRQSLWAGLKCKKPETRRNAARVVRDLRVSGLGRVLSGALSDPDPAVAALAAGAVWIRNEKAREVIRKLSEHPDARVRQEAAAGLGLRPHLRFASELLLGRLATDGHPDVRVQALGALGRIGPGRAAVFQRSVRVLLEATRDPSGRVRAEALHQLLRLRRPAVWPDVKRSLSDPHLGARLAAVGLMKRSRLGRQRYRDLAQGQDLFVALRAAVILSRRREPGFRSADLALVKDVLRRAGEDARGDVRAAACNAAASMREFRPARQTVYWGLADRHPRVRMAAARTGLTLGAARQKAINALGELIRTRSDLAVPAAHILALRGIPSGVEALKRLALKGRSEQKRSAVAMLGSLRKELDAVLGAWASGPWAVRIQADRALWQWWRR